jgi:hypothetical protein
LNVVDSGILQRVAQGGIMMVVGGKKEQKTPQKSATSTLSKTGESAALTQLK